MARYVTKKHSCRGIFILVFKLAFLAIFIPAFFTLKGAEAENSSTENEKNTQIEKSEESIIKKTEQKQQNNALSVKLLPEGNKNFEFGKYTPITIVIKNISEKALVVTYIKFLTNPDTIRLAGSAYGNVRKIDNQDGYAYNELNQQMTGMAFYAGFLLPGQEVTIQQFFRPVALNELFDIAYMEASSKYDGTKKSLLPFNPYIPEYIENNMPNYYPFDENKWNIVNKTYPKIEDNVGPDAPRRSVLLPDLNQKERNITISIPINYDTNAFTIEAAKEAAGKISGLPITDFNLAYSSALEGYIVIEKGKSWILKNKNQKSQGTFYSNCPASFFKDIDRKGNVRIRVGDKQEGFGPEEHPTKRKFWDTYPVFYGDGMYTHGEFININKDNMLSFLQRLTENNRSLKEHPYFFSSRYFEIEPNETENKVKSTQVSDAQDFIKYIEIGAQKKEVNWILRVVMNYIYEPNIPRIRYSSELLLKKPGTKEELIATDVSKLTQIDDIKVSPDGKYLAVRSKDIFGSMQILEVIDLPVLLERKKYKVLQTIDPFPEGIEIEKWDGDKLIVKSSVLLTRIGKDGRIPDEVLARMQIQKYSLSMPDGKIEGLSEGAKNPAAYFLKQFDGRALVYLDETSIVPKLEKIMAQETDAEGRKRKQEIIDSVFFRFNLEESFNIINKDTTEKDIRKIYGNENVEDANIPIGEGEYEPGTVVYPKDETKKLEIAWEDVKNKRLLKKLFISGTKSKWTIYFYSSIKLGTKLSELEKFNGRPFILTGFDWDYSGTVVDWKYGYMKTRLGDTRTPSNRKILLRLSTTKENSITRKEYRTVQGDKPILSDNPVMQKLDPEVYQIIVEFPENSPQAATDFQTYSDDTNHFSYGLENKGLRCTALAPLEVEQGMNLFTIVKLQCIPDHLDKGVKQLNMFMRDAFLTLILTNKKNGKTIVVWPHDPSHGMPNPDYGVKTLTLIGNSLKPWEVMFPLATQRKVLEPGLYLCQIQYSYPNEPGLHWNNWTNNDWDSYGFWSGTIQSQTFDLEIIKEIPKTRKVLLPKKLHYDKEKRTITYSKEDAVEVKLPIRNGCFPGTDFYIGKNGNFDMSGGISGFIDPGDPLDNCIDPPADGKFIYKIRIFETSEPVGHMWSPASGDYKVLWEKTFEFKADD
jgi:hypothetical protein